MKFFYSDTESHEPYRPRGTLDANTMYLKHLGNWFELKRYYALGSLPEKLQATRELVICERKLHFWRQKPSFDQAMIQAEQTRLSTLWGISFVPNTFDERQQKWIRQTNKR